MRAKYVGNDASLPLKSNTTYTVCIWFGNRALCLVTYDEPHVQIVYYTIEDFVEDWQLVYTGEKS